MGDALSRQRSKVLKHARHLARTGQHSDCRSIAIAVQEIEGFSDARQWFEDRRFLAQLDKLCGLAREMRTKEEF